MRYGYFDDQAREYVIDRVDAPQSMTNYLGTQRMGPVISHNAGGYSWLDSPQHHRITRFRPNGVPMDWPGHYVYLRDDESGKYWSLSWQPTGLPLDEAKYEARHGMSYSRFSCETEGIRGEQTLFIPREDGDEDPVEIFDVKVIKVTTTYIHRKEKRVGAQPSGMTAKRKKAVVKLSADSKNIEIFEGMV